VGTRLRSLGMTMLLPVYLIFYIRMSDFTRAYRGRASRPSSAARRSRTFGASN